jgi:uncharacterized protein (UPF0332 family)
LSSMPLRPNLPEPQLLDPQQFLKQANELARRANGKHNPIDARRAISNAYYAVFHAVLGGAADLIVGKTKRRSSIYALVYRSIDHGYLEGLCKELLKQQPRPKYSDCLPYSKPSVELHAFSGAVVDLKTKRNRADYDPQYRVVRSDAIAVIRTAEGALQNLSAISKAERDAFFHLTLFEPR